MSIVTRTGDKGTTRLFSGEKVPKFHPRVEAYGDIDELISVLGVVVATTSDKEIIELIRKIQLDLFIVSGELATSNEKKEKLKKRLSSSYIKFLENFIFEYEDRVDSRKGFVIPGKNSISAFLDIARTIARRSERKVAKLASEEKINPLNLVYLNRLSDLLYILARFSER